MGPHSGKLAICRQSQTVLFEGRLTAHSFPPNQIGGVVGLLRVSTWSRFPDARSSSAPSHVIVLWGSGRKPVRCVEETVQQ
jgi:hypothetical protein